MNLNLGSLQVYDNSQSGEEIFGMPEVCLQEVT